MITGKYAFTYDAKHVECEIQFVSITFHPTIYCYTQHEIIEHELIVITVASAF